MISNAFAQAAPAAAQDPLSSITGVLPLIFMFVVLWFLMIRPQMKRAKEHKALLEGLQKVTKSSPRAASSASRVDRRRLRHRRSRQQHPDHRPEANHRRRAAGAPSSRSERRGGRNLCSACRPRSIHAIPSFPPDHEPLSSLENLLIGLVLLWGLIYTLPNFYGRCPPSRSPAAKATLKLDATTPSSVSRKASRRPASSTTACSPTSPACAPASA